jgi:hypothetical protein
MIWALMPLEGKSETKLEFGNGHFKSDFAMVVREGSRVSTTTVTFTILKTNAPD